MKEINAGRSYELKPLEQQFADVRELLNPDDQIGATVEQEWDELMARIDKRDREKSIADKRARAEKRKR